MQWLPTAVTAGTVLSSIPRLARWDAVVGSVWVGLRARMPRAPGLRVAIRFVVPLVWPVVDDRAAFLLAVRRDLGSMPLPIIAVARLEIGWPRARIERRTCILN
jgi:hypothetical protein